MTEQPKYHGFELDDGKVDFIGLNYTEHLQITSAGQLRNLRTSRYAPCALNLYLCTVLTW